MIQFGFSYFLWHYTVALRDLFRICKNFLWFIWHFFSIGVLSRTLFSPWQKLDEPYKKGFEIGALFETFIVNTLMRIVGFFIRAIMIVTGLASLLLVLGLEVVVFIVWLLFPFIITVLFISGLRLILR